eukprot:752276-Hanusia_phi.AAC.9
MSEHDTFQMEANKASLTTTTLTFFEATSFNSLPCSLKMLQFFARRSFLSIPGPRGKAPSMMHASIPVKATLASEVTTTSSNKSKPQSSSSIFTPMSACHQYHFAILALACSLQQIRHLHSRLLPSSPIAASIPNSMLALRAVILTCCALGISRRCRMILVEGPKVLPEHMWGRRA